ncbi:MAG: hypothetical protein JW844_00415 [Candidatus Omnitrophica bacterium]|nr:hypothetical protein [Candidatus Omnitrophota bacterium]
MIVHTFYASKALSKTGIDIADFVINPYRGCTYGCVYCYAQQNKNIKKRKEKWGSFVDVKINILNLLQEELRSGIMDVSQRVLIGSVTEPYQPIEKDMRFTRGILHTLNDFGKSAVILTRSPLICEDAELIIKGGHTVFFTLNTFTPLDPENPAFQNGNECTIGLEQKQKSRSSGRCLTGFAGRIKEGLEPAGPSLDQRLDAVARLVASTADVRIHIGPVIPGLTDCEMLFAKLPPGCTEVALELYNFKMGSWPCVRTVLEREAPQAVKLCEEITASPEIYEGYCRRFRDEIATINRKYGYSLRFFIPQFDAYFDNEAYHYEVS